MKQIGALEPLEGCRDILNGLLLIRQGEICLARGSRKWTLVCCPVEQPQPSRKRKRLGQMCALCRVTESPEWRKGPEGKRNLCNRCGLRWSKSSRQEGVRVNVIIANQDHLSKTHHLIPNISASSVLPDVTTTHCMQKENSESRVGVCEQTPNGYPEWEIKNVGISAVDFAAYSSTSDAQVSLVRQIIPLGSPSSLHWTDFTCDFSIDWQFYSQAGEPL